MDAYPHQLSGGMSQRVAIAMAIAGEPKLLIADEPTTALDVTIQAQIMDLLLALQKEQNMGLVLITHDLAVVAETAQRVCVMYAGQAVEVGQVPQLFDIPAHPTAKRCSRRSRTQPRRRAPGHPARHRARPLRPPAGLPAVAALPVRAGQLPPARPALDPKPTASRAASTR
jgi:dipeptide transport system ATP-binding protein